jgi:sulfhydrogenase subunit gamma (sulfur reductase)
VNGEQANPYIPKAAAVASVKNESLDSKTLKLRLINWLAQFQPGQFVQLLLPGVGEAPFCIASSPSDQKHLELTIMRRGIVTTAAQYLRPGDAVGVRGPLGKPFPLDKLEGKDLVVVATGIGIAALRSLLLHISENRGKFGAITLLYGARFPEDLVYREDLKRWSENMKVIVTLSKATPEWQGLRGRVTDHLAGLSLSKDAAAVVCGSPAVMESLASELVKRGIVKNKIYVSLERHMKCGIGKCARCLIMGGLLVCKDGPVFSANEIDMKAIGE